MPGPNSKEPVKFIITFLVLFMVFYFFNLAFFSATSPGNKYYISFLAQHINYIDGLRWLLLQSSTLALKCLGYVAICNKYHLLVAGHGAIQLVYTCLGLGVMSFFAAFTLAYPKPVKQRIIFMVCGIIGIQLLNVLRFVLLSLYWDKRAAQVIDHHTIFNILIYVIIIISLYFWIKADTRKTNAIN